MISALWTIYTWPENVPRSRHEEKFKNMTIPVHNTLFGFRYAPEKEVTFTSLIVLPNKNSIDSAFNLTFPGFDSCTVGVRLLETIRKEYKVREQLRLYFSDKVWKLTDCSPFYRLTWGGNGSLDIQSRFREIIRIKRPWWRNITAWNWKWPVHRSTQPIWTSCTRAMTWTCVSKFRLV